MSAPFPISQPTATILDGESLSNAVSIGHGRLVGIVVPASWTTAVITFQGSADGTNFYDMYDSQGAEITCQAASSVYITIDDAAVGPWLKLRSGTTGSPTTQSGDIALTLVVQKFTGIG